MGLEELSVLDLAVHLGRGRWERAEHLGEYAGAIERALDGHARVMCSVPAQHWKSTTTLVGVVWMLLRRPSLRILIMTHSYAKAQAMAKDLRELAELAGIKMKKGFSVIDDWRTEQDGGCVCMSVDQSKLGYPHDVLLVDDSLNEATCEEQSARDEVDKKIAFYTDRGRTHLDSVILVGSRWKIDDPLGRREMRKAQTWERYCYAGVMMPDGRAARPDPPPGMTLLAFWESIGARAYAPDVLDLAGHAKSVEEQRELDPSLRTWWAQTQNDPLPDESGFFVGERAYSGPYSMLSPIIGIDAAFTAGKKSDYAAGACTTMVGSHMLIFEAWRHKLGLGEVIHTLHEKRERLPGCRFVTYASGPEVGVYHHLFQVGGIEVEIMPARWNKATRAQPAARAWRKGDIMYLAGAPWRGILLAEVHAFNGSETGVDDLTDSIVSAYDAQMMSRPAPGFDGRFTFGHPVM